MASHEQKKERGIYLLTLAVEDLRTGEQLIGKGIPFTKDQLKSTIELVEKAIKKISS